MQVNPVTSDNTSFQSLIIKKSAIPIIEKMSKRERLKLFEIKNSLESSKHWDMEISGLKTQKGDTFCCRFINKKNPEDVLESDIKADIARHQSVLAHSLVKGERTYRRLIFPTAKRAKEMKEMTQRQSAKHIANNFKRTNIQELTNWEEQLNFLDEAYSYMNEKSLMSYLNFTWPLLK